MANRGALEVRCSVAECRRPAYYGCRSWCAAHYGRYQRHGDPQHQVREIGRSQSERFWEKVDRSGDCWTWTARCAWSGYGQFGVQVDGRWRSQMAHRVAWEMSNGPIPQGMLVCHVCDNPPCVKPGHLFLGTTADNAQDRERKGRGYRLPVEQHARGTRVHHAKLTDEAVREIRQRYALGGVTQQQLGEEFGVNQTKISNVVRNRTWRHVVVG